MKGLTTQPGFRSPMDHQKRMQINAGPRHVPKSEASTLNRPKEKDMSGTSELYATAGASALNLLSGQNAAPKMQFRFRIKKL